MEYKETIKESEEAISGEQKPIQCNSCSKKLGTLFVTDKQFQQPKTRNPSLQIELPLRYQFQCACGGKTFVIKTKNVSYIVPLDNVDMKNFKQDKNLFTALLMEKK